MDEGWFLSPAYQELVAAMRKDDIAAQNAILTRQVGQTTGSEKAFWVLARAAIRARHTQFVLDPTWSDLDEALVLAPEDRQIQQQALLQALNLTNRTERLEGLRQVLRRLKPYLRELLPSHAFIQANLGLLQMKRGRYHDAFARITEMFRLAEEHGEQWQRSHAGGLQPMHAELARAAFRIGWMAEGAAALARAEAYYRERPEFGVSHFLIALAQAEQAFQQRDFHAARLILQQATAQAVQGTARVVTPMVQVEAELIAARIAGAEGNPEGASYFCDRAVSLIAHLNRPLTAAQIEAVRQSEGVTPS